MYQHRVTPLTESGLLSALTVVLAMVAIYLPVVGTIALFIWALPLIVLVVRQGVRWGIMSIIIAGIIMALLIEPLTALQLTLSMAPMGLVLGLGFRKHWSGTKTFGFALLTSLISKLILLGALFLLTATNPLTAQLDLFQESVDTSLAMYQSMGMDQGQLEETRSQLEHVTKMMATLLPLIIAGMGLVDTLVGYLVGSRVLKRLGYIVPQFPPFHEWHLPRVFLYICGFSLIGLYWGTTHDLSLLYQVSMNFLMLSFFAGLVQGFAIAQYVMIYYHLSKPIRFFVYLLAILSGIIGQSFAIIGLLDMVFDFRRRAESRKRG